MAETDASWIAPITSVSLTAWPGEAPALAERLRAAVGLKLAEARRWTEAGELVCIWLGPDHWQIEREGTHDLARMLAVAAGPHGGVIDVTDARAVLRIAGSASRSILSRLLPLDLHPRAFGPHHAASTLAAHISVQIRQIDATPTYHLACPCSYANSLRSAVEQASVGRLRWR